METKPVQLDILRANLARFIAIEPGPEPKDRVWLEIIYQLCDEIERDRADDQQLRMTVVALKAERDALRVDQAKLARVIAYRGQCAMLRTEPSTAGLRRALDGE